MPSIRTVGNFFRLSCRRQDKNKLLVSAFRLVNLDITQASTITHTHTHALLHFAFPMSLWTFLCWGTALYTGQVHGIASVTVWGQQTATSTHSSPRSWIFLVIFINFHSFTPLWKHCQQCSFKSHTSKKMYTLAIFPLFLYGVKSIPLPSCIKL